MSVVDLRRSPHTRLRPLPLAAARIQDAFWAPRIERTRRVTLRQQYEQCEATGRIDNFRRAAGAIAAEFQGRFYNDSDVYKWLEGVCFALATDPTPKLRELADRVVDAIVAAQSPDGYLNTYFTFEREAERWTDLAHLHELYCAGHLMQAAVAHHRATGETRLLEVATRLADHIGTVFGPDARAGTDGHEEIELALVELYRETGRRAYLDQAGFFLDVRGRGLLLGRAYFQDHLPVREQSEIVGHAVRATYLACGMADVYAETGDPALLAACERLWESAFERKAYVTGGLGARWEGEAFGDDFELPNERAYAETCAAIGGFMWSWRMLLLTGASRYADWMETALYNGILAGVSLDGESYFYQNPLADRGGHRRQPWFGTACCPPNLARLLTSLPGYLATASDDGVELHHYVGGLIEAGPTVLLVDTRYPWEGQVRIAVAAAPPGESTLRLRVPGWCARATVAVDEAPVEAEREDGYLVLRRAWRGGEVIELELAMPVRRIAGDPRVAATAGRIALARGPLVYCLEGADRPARDVYGLAFEPDAYVTAEEAPGLLDGVVVLRGMATRPPGPPVIDRFPVTAIPYYAWANREPSPMQVWTRVLAEPAVGGATGAFSTDGTSDSMT